MKQSERVAKNAVFGMLAAGLGGGLYLASLLIVARWLGVAEFGIFSYLLAFASIFQFASDFGLSNILVREIARRPQELENLLGSAKALMWIMFGCGLIALGLFVTFLPMSPQLRELSWLMGIGYLSLIHSVPFLSVVRASEHMELNALGFILHKIVMFAAIWLSLHWGYGLVGVVFCHILANLFQWLYYHLIVTIGFSPGRLRFEPALWKRLLAESLPMGGGMVVRQFSWQVDIFILTWLVTPAALGLFSGPFRLLIGMTLASAILTTTLFPLFVRLAHEASPEFKVVYQGAVKWFCLLSLPVMAVTLAWPEVWIHVLLGKQYLAAIPATQVLSFALTPIFISVLYPYVFCALGRQKDFLWSSLGAVLVRVLLGILLVPRFGYLSSCCVIVLVEIGLWIALSLRLKNLGHALNALATVGKPVLAILPVILILSISRHASPMAMAGAAILSAIVYAAFLAWSQTFTPKEIALAREGLGFMGPYLNSLRIRRNQGSKDGIDPNGR